MPPARSPLPDPSHQKLSPYLRFLLFFLPVLVIGLLLFTQASEPPASASPQAILPPEGSPDSSTPSDEEVFSSLSLLLGSNDTELVSIQYLSSAEVSSLAGSQPVLYSDLTGPLYKITIKQEGKLLVILYDFNSNVVLKQFMVHEVHLN